MTGRSWTGCPGNRAVLEQALSIATRGAAGLHVSFDLDVCGPSIASGVGEITPILDSANQTAILGAGLALSALGKRIP